MIGTLSQRMAVFQGISLCSGTQCHLGRFLTVTLGDHSNADKGVTRAQRITVAWLRVS